MRSTRIGAAAVARGCAAIVTVAVKVSSDVASELMEVTGRLFSHREVTGRLFSWER